MMAVAGRRSASSGVTTASDNTGSDLSLSSSAAASSFACVDSVKDHIREWIKDQHNVCRNIPGSYFFFTKIWCFFNMFR